MSAPEQLLSIQRRAQSAQCIIPVVAGCLMIGASMTPWLNDPISGAYTTWALPVDVGWNYRSGFFNYGTICSLCAIYPFFICYRCWRAWPDLPHNESKSWGMVCAVPPLLFLLQYLCIDMAAVALLAGHQRQALLIQQHLGYSVPAWLIHMEPFTLNYSTFMGRLQLLINHISFGFLLPCISSGIALRDGHAIGPSLKSTKKSLARLTCIILVPVVLLGRAPIGMVCEYQARNLLSSGSYSQTLRMLDIALFFNPALEQVTYYHIERGQALYFLFPKQVTSDTLSYLAFMYRSQGDYLDAYQQLLALRRQGPTPGWASDEMTITLSRLAELSQPLRKPSQKRPATITAALPWLQALAQGNPSDSYAVYMMGRIYYQLHDYDRCTQYMSMVLRLSANNTILSSAYTYMALSYEGQGKYAGARLLLFNAIMLDPSYRNTTAREELSGLH